MVRGLKTGTSLRFAQAGETSECCRKTLALPEGPLNTTRTIVRVQRSTAPLARYSRPLNTNTYSESYHTEYSGTALAGVLFHCKKATPCDLGMPLKAYYPFELARSEWIARPYTPITTPQTKGYFDLMVRLRILRYGIVVSPPKAT